jgi:hypothetical protein
MEEDQARLGLESTVATLRRAQMQVNDALAAEQAARGRRNNAFLEPESEPYGWMGPESEAQLQRVLAVRSARTIPRLEQEAQIRRDGFLDRRRERQKLESLLTRAEEQEAMERERRSRAELDDLVQSRRRYEWLRSQEELT